MNKIQDFNDDEVLKEYIEHKDILDVVESFIGPNIMSMHTMLIMKPPDIGFGSSKYIGFIFLNLITYFFHQKTFF